jgi:hypothetical protein
MSEQQNKWEGDDFGETQNEDVGRPRGLPLRMRQLRFEAQVRLADAQKSLASATVRSARYMLWTTIVCAVSSVITVLAVLYSLLVVLPRVVH